MSHSKALQKGWVAHLKTIELPSEKNAGKLSEENAGQQVAHQSCFAVFEANRVQERQLKGSVIRNKSRIQKSGQSMDLFLLAPTHSVGFWRISQVYTYPRRGVWPFEESISRPFTRDMLVRSCISKSTAMPLFRISLAFQHNSWAKRCRLPHLSSFYTYIGYWNIFPYKMAGTKVPVPCVPPTAAHLITWTFVIYHAAMKMKNPCILQPSNSISQVSLPVLVDTASRTHRCIDLWS